LPTDDRGKLDRTLALFAETVQPGHDDPLDGIGHTHLGKIFNKAIATVRTLEDAKVEKGLGNLLDEQRHTLRLFHEGGA
jgi:hypothetical protein